MTINSDIAHLVAITVLLIFSSQRFARLEVNFLEVSMCKERESDWQVPWRGAAENVGQPTLNQFPPSDWFPFPRG
jgi:hypothetical protein